MKKLFVTLTILCFALSSWAVDIPKQGFGIQIGWTQPILRINDKSHKDTLNNTVKMKGFKLGVVYDASYIAGFGSSMGINYTFAVSNSGWESVNPNYNVYPKARTLINYHQLELFVDWQYKFEIAKETYLMLYSGPTIQCGMAFGMRKDTKVENLITGEISTEYGSRYSGYDNSNDPDQIFKRINVTWGVGAGFQYQRYFLRGGYDFGLIVPFKNTDFSNGTHTRGRLDQWSIKIGMYLWYAD